MVDILAEQKEEIVKESLGYPRDFFELMKPRVMSLVVFTAFVGYACGYFSTDLIINPWLSIIGVFAIALGAEGWSMMSVQDECFKNVVWHVSVRT